MTDEPEDPNRPDNLWEPVPGDHGAHGRFDHLARSTSWQLQADLHRGWLAAAGGCLAGLALAALVADRPGRSGGTLRSLSSQRS
jgi:hypothetical protein